MAQVTYKFNIITVAIIVLAIFACGFFARQSYYKAKEIRKIEKQVTQHKEKIKEYSDIIILKSDTITQLKTLIEKTNVSVAKYRSSIGKLEAKIEELKTVNEIVPTSRKYDVLVERTEPDTLPKSYCFSDRQIGWLYEDNQELPVRRDQVLQYDALTQALNYNLELASETYRIANENLTVCENKNSEYEQALLLKEQQVNMLKKQKRGRGFWAVASTVTNVILTGFLIAK